MQLTKELQEVLYAAFDDARRRRHEYLTLEHVLYAMSNDRNAAKILRGVGVDLEQLRFDLSNAGSDAVGYLLGLPAPALAICPTCRLGLSTSGPLIHFPSTLQLVLRLPADVSLLGGTLAVQGYGAGSGTCFGVLRFSDTIDFTIG